MSYPFPGMNPWLENPKLWRGVHQRLITALADVLAPLLEPRYFVEVETHTYISTAPTQPIRTRYPDVSILKIGGPAVAATQTTEAVLPLEIDLALPEPYEEPYLEIRLVPEGEVITVIELLSHTHKRKGDERESYAAVDLKPGVFQLNFTRKTPGFKQSEIYWEKRKALFDTDVHFVEIDLLRAWKPMPYAEHPSADYRIFIRRREKRRKALLYAFSLRQPIPRFLLPLLPDDQEPLVDLGAILHDVYDRARYRLVINYTKPSTPRLSKADAAWAAEWLATIQTQ